MSTNETPTSIPPELDRITVVLRPQEGSTLNQVHQFVGTGLIVAIGRGLGVLEHYCQGDVIQRLGEARELHMAQTELYEAALGAPAHLAAHAQEMFDLLHRINVKVGGLNAVLGHGGEPSEQMWDESHEAMDAIWDLLDKVKSVEVFGSPSLIAEIPVVTDPMHIDDRLRMIGAEPAYLTVVFKLPSLNDAQPLIAQLPYGQKALGTEAVVFGMTTGNLMEGAE